MTAVIEKNGVAGRRSLFEGLDLGENLLTGRLAVTQHLDVLGIELPAPHQRLLHGVQIRIGAESCRSGRSRDR